MQMVQFEFPRHWKPPVPSIFRVGRISVHSVLLARRKAACDIRLCDVTRRVKYVAMRARSFDMFLKQN